jgi:hypothetical protein
MGNALIIIGCIMILFSFIWLLIIAFGQSVWWGLAVVICPGAPILFSILNIKETCNPLTLIVVGLIAEWGGKALGGTATFSMGLTDVLVIIVGSGGGYLARTMGYLDAIIPAR